jgi:quercetin dioxygenase-like cupin family protein
MARGLRVSPRGIRFGVLGLVAAASAGCAFIEAAEVPETVATTEPAPATETVSVIDVAAGEYEASVEISVGIGEGVQVVFREIVLAPGARTGEHCHHGQLVAVIKQGELTHYAPVYPDGVHVYREDDAIVEGAEYIHEGVNEGDDDVVLWVTYLIEAGEPLAETDLSRCAD